MKKTFFHKINGHITTINKIKYKIIATENEISTYKHLRKIRYNTKYFYPKHSVMLIKYGKRHIVIISLDESPYRRLRLSGYCY